MSFICTMSLEWSFSEISCFMLTLGRRFLVTEFIMFIDALALTRYIYIFHLKNPAAFQDEFWHLFINIWMIGANTLIQCATMPFEFQGLPAYLACRGKNDQIHETQNVLYFFHAQIISAVLHAFIYLRIWMFRRKSKVSNITSYRNIKSLFLADLNKESLMDIAESFGFMIFLGAVAAIHVLIFKMSDPKEISRTASSLLITPTLVVLASAGTLYWRNRLMRQWINREVINIISNQIERLGFELQPIAVT